jgi:hypothetical protein
LRVLTNAEIGFSYASGEATDGRDDWEEVSESAEIFPPGFEWSSWIDHNLKKNSFFNFASKDFNGADVKWTRGESCLLQELMHRDVRILLNCYSNDFFPKIWGQILNVYLNDGFPCGWEGKHPDGKLVVFSNF